MERLLLRLPPAAFWVALSDQDDIWRHDELERLVPTLADVALVSGQARLTEHPAGRVLGTTTRRWVPVDDLVMENQVTGSLSVFRRDLLDLALPFPRLHTPTQMHDHWLGACAASTSGYAMVEEVVQDYVQHADNVVGETLSIRRRREPIRALREIATIIDEYEGGHSPIRAARACQNLSFGWRRVMVAALLARLEQPPMELMRLKRQLDSASGLSGLAGLLRRIQRSEYTTSGAMDPFLPGLPGEVATRVTTLMKVALGSGSTD